MRLGIIAAIIGILLSWCLPKVARGPVYSHVQVDQVTGRIDFEFDPRDADRPAWRNPESIAMAVNLPALVIAVPMQLLIWRGAPLPVPVRMPWLIWSSTILGVIFWFFLGKFVQQCWLMSKGRPFDSPTKMDWFFAVSCTVVGGFGTAAWFSGNDLPDLLWLAVGGAFWGLIGFAALVIRILQLRGIRRALRAEVGS